MQPSEPQQPQDTELVSWQSAEYEYQEKDPVWFAIFAVIVVAMMAGAVLLRAWTFAILIPVMAASLLIYLRRPPRVLECTLGQQGLYINDSLFPYSDYRSFALMGSESQHSVMLIPIKRFRPGLTVSFPNEAGEVIVDVLAARLPMVEAELDLVDGIIRKLRL